MISITMMTRITNPIDIHIGDNTHHHDQSILPISFRVMNTTVSRPQNPMPPDDEDDSLLMFYYLMIFERVSRASVNAKSTAGVVDASKLPVKLFTAFTRL